MDVLSATQAAFTELSAGDASPASQDSGSSNDQANSQPAAETTGTSTTEGQTAAAETTPSTDSGSEAPQGGGPLPWERHKAILEKTRKEYDEKLAKLSWAEKLEVSDPATVAERLRVVELAEKNPMEFLARFQSRLAQDPRYAPMLQRLQQPSREEPAQSREESMPEPDIELEDGRKFYSSQQTLALLKWQQGQIEQRYAPLEHQFRGQQAWNTALQRNAQRLAEARTWEGFTENEAAIKEAMMKDGRATLESAYRNVVVPKLKADRATLEADLRKSLLAELNSKPSASTEQPGRAAATTPQKYGRGQTADAVRDVFNELAGR